MVSSIFVGFQLMSFFAEFAELQDVAYIDFHVPVTFKNSMGKFWKSWIRIQNSRPIHISFHSNGANVSMDYSGPASLAIFVPDPANLEHSIKQFQHLMDQSLAVDNVNVNWLLDLNSTGSRNRILEYLKKYSFQASSGQYYNLFIPVPAWHLIAMSMVLRTMTLTTLTLKNSTELDHQD